MISFATIASLIVAAFLLTHGVCGAAENGGADKAGDPGIQAAKIPQTAPGKPLDLRAPDITKIFTPEQLNQVLSRTIDRENIEEVEVEGVRSKQPTPPSSPAVWGAIAAPFWALLHPTQAWRIIAPIPPDRAQYIGNEPPDATDSYRPPTLPP